MFQSFTPTDYLKIDIASSFGLDKESWDDRIDWFEKNRSALETIHKNPSNAQNHELMKESEEPAQMFAGINAFFQTSRGKATGYPISLDATASGAQLLAVAVNCEKSARMCNVIDTGRREDLYTNVFNGMKGRLGTVGQITRAKAKDATMKALYSSKAVPRRIFGEGEQLDVFYKTLEEDIPGIWELNEALTALWQSDTLSHDWIMPDNFHVYTKVMSPHVETIQFFNTPMDVVSEVNQPAPQGRSIGANSNHSIDGLGVREISRRCTYNKEQVFNLVRILRTGANWSSKVTRNKDELLLTLQDRFFESGFFSARMLGLVDEQNISKLASESKTALAELIDSLPATPFPVLSVHDCFRVHANYGNDVRRQYNQFLYELSKSEITQYIASQITKQDLKFHKYGDISHHILDANYTLS